MIAGDLQGAGQACRLALVLAPQSEASHRVWRAFLSQTERWPQLVLWAERGLQLWGNSDLRCELALGLLRGGAHEEALIWLRRAIADTPSAIQPWLYLAEAEEVGGRTKEALAVYVRCRMLSSGSAEALNALVAFLGRTASRKRAALALLEMVGTAVDRADVVAMLEQAARFALGAADAALAIVAMKRCSAIAPDNEPALCFLSEVVRDEDPGRAFLLARRFVALAPIAAEAHGTLALASRVSQKFATAEASWRRALATLPQYLPAFVNLPQLLVLDSRTAEALRWARRALALAPPTPLVLWNLGQVLITHGHADPGVKLEENRLVDHSDPSKIRSRIARPRWDGEPLADRSLLIWLERGLADQLYYARWLEMVRPGRGPVFVECDPRLARTYQRSFPHLRIVAVQPTVEETVGGGPIDLQVPIGSLPLIFLEDTEAAFAAARRGQRRSSPQYLRADPDLIRRWDAELASRARRLRVGVSWRSGLLTGSRKVYYMAVSTIVSMFRDLPVTVINLQYAAMESELAELRDGLDDFYNPSIDLKNDLEDVSALLANCDVVVAPGIAVLSHAAALGRPSWYCGFGRDWMFPNLDIHPLLPSVEYFCRGLSNDWDDVAIRVRLAIIERLRTREGRSAGS
jgi:Tfp pilus assembly protein PilF